MALQKKFHRYRQNSAPIFLLALIAFMLLSIASVCFAAENEWSSKASMLTPRGWLSTGVTNGKIYAVGGIDGNGAASSKLEEYDPLTNKWTTKADMRP